MPSNSVCVQRIGSGVDDIVSALLVSLKDCNTCTAASARRDASRVTFIWQGMVVCD